MQVGHQAVVFRAAFPAPLKAGSSVVVTLPWMYALPHALQQGRNAHAADADSPAPEPHGLAAVPSAEMGAAQLIVRSVAYPA